MDAKRIANKYVEPGGYVRGERDKAVAGDLLAFLSFIAWHDDSHMQGGYRAREAFLAACRVLALDPVEMRRIVRGE
jgi:hypothetical protein